MGGRRAKMKRLGYWVTGRGEWGGRPKIVILRLVSVRIYTLLILSFEVLIIICYLLSLENVC